MTTRSITVRDAETGEERAIPTEDVLEPVVSTVITAEELMAQDDLDVRYIRLPAPWQGGIKARPLTMHELHQMRKRATLKVKNPRTGKLEEQYDMELANKVLLRMSLVDPALDDAQVASLMQKNSRLVLAILTELNKLSATEDEDAAEVVEEAEAEF